MGSCQRQSSPRAGQTHPNSEAGTPSPVFFFGLVADFSKNRCDLVRLGATSCDLVILAMLGFRGGSKDFGDLMDIEIVLWSNLYGAQSTGKMNVTNQPRDCSAHAIAKCPASAILMALCSNSGNESQRRRQTIPTSISVGPTGSQMVTCLTSAKLWMPVHKMTTIQPGLRTTGIIPTIPAPLIPGFPQTAITAAGRRTRADYRTRRAMAAQATREAGTVAGGIPVEATAAVEGIDT